MACKVKSTKLAALQYPLPSFPSRCISSVSKNGPCDGFHSWRCQLQVAPRHRRGIKNTVSNRASIRFADAGEHKEYTALWNHTGLRDLMHQARILRDTGHDTITFSPKVFLPLTRLCRDSCGYCTFAQPPLPGRRAYMQVEEVVQVAMLGAAQGCTEALFTLGDKPELLYEVARDELRAMGFSSTLEYVHHAAQAVLERTGLLPHINAGVMAEEDLRRLREVSASQGLMLEATAASLMLPGGAHHDCPDKDPAVRLATLEAAGKAAVPMTTGLLVGIGEGRADRVEALLAVRDLHQRYGHIQEVIIQNFRAKKHTAMEHHPEPPLDELLATVAMARIILGPNMNIQAPPNLTPGPLDTPGSMEQGWRQLLDAGINDWGGISPITRDFVNPEKPWPHLTPLAQVTAAAGKLLLPRLPTYPSYISDADRWLDHSSGAKSVGAAVRRCADSSGLVRGSTWYAGQREDREAEEASTSSTSSTGSISNTGTSMGRSSIDSSTAGSRSTSSTGSSSTSSTSSSHIDNVGVIPGGGLGGDAPCGSESTVQRIQSNAMASSSSRSPLKPSTPLPHAHASAAWGVRVAVDGGMEGFPRPDASPAVLRLLEAVMGEGRELSEREICILLAARGADFHAVCAAADLLRQRVNGDTVSYVVNRNINYTNVCTYGCTFCAFSKGKAQEQLRGAPYMVTLEEISRRTAEAWDRGATEVCMQGGIHPDFTGETYLQILQAAKRGAPDIHVHAFSPLEVLQGATTLDLPIPDYLTLLKKSGLGSLPGTAAEVLDDAVRAMLCPDKLSTAQWCEVMEAAHSVGLPTTSTLMFGHLEGTDSWARHLLVLRSIQKRTGGFTEFVPLPFVHMEAPVYLKGRARKGPTLHECVLLHAVSRLTLHPHITNIQASWVKMGPERAALLLASGCNDMGGSIMNESITKAAGASHGQELPPSRMEGLIRAATRIPRQRTTLYGNPPTPQTERSFSAKALLPPLTVSAFR